MLLWNQGKSLIEEIVKFHKPTIACRQEAAANFLHKLGAFISCIIVQRSETIS